MVEINNPYVVLVYVYVRDQYGIVSYEVKSRDDPHGAETIVNLLASVGKYLGPFSISEERIEKFPVRVRSTP